MSANRSEVYDMGKYFGTDGFRGEANLNLTADHAYKVGRFLGWYYSQLKLRSGSDDPARIVIGKDTRRSSYMFEYALVGGLVASGADAYLLHVTTTPSVAYVVRTDGFDCGIMISASHNPYYDNGIKLINGSGEKMDERTILLVEAYLDGNLNAFDRHWDEIPLAKREKIGRTVDYVAGRNRYVGYLISLGIYSFKTDILKCRQNPSLMTSAQLRRTSEVLGKLLGWLIPPPGLQAPQCIHVWDSSESK